MCTISKHDSGTDSYDDASYKIKKMRSGGHGTAINLRKDMAFTPQL